jgi:hypothetical protein
LPEDSVLLEKPLIEENDELEEKSAKENTSLNLDE